MTLVQHKQIEHWIELNRNALEKNKTKTKTKTYISNATEEIKKIPRKCQISVRQNNKKNK